MSESIKYIMSIVAWFDLVFIAFCAALYVLPMFSCPSTREPLVRIVQWAYPRESGRFYVKHVSQTVIHEQWYVKSISEYAGARGTTSTKIVSTAGSVFGAMQIFLALLLWSQDSDLFGNSSLLQWRVALYCLGGAGCAVLGNIESPILWEYGRIELVRSAWSRATYEERWKMVLDAQRKLKELMGKKTFSEEEKFHMPQSQDLSNALTDLDAIVKEHLQVSTQDQKENVGQLVSLKTEEAGNRKSLEQKNPQTEEPNRNTELKTEELKLNAEQKANTESSPRSNHSDDPATPKGSYQQLIPCDADIEKRQARTNCVSRFKTEAEFRSYQAKIEVSEKKIDLPDLPPYGYVLYHVFERQVAEESEGLPMTKAMVQKDQVEKGQFVILHMISAFVFVAGTAIGNVLALSISTTRTASVGVVLSGVVIILIYVFMTLITGNYDYDPGLANFYGSQKTPQPKSLLSYFHWLPYAQYEVRNYYPRCRRGLGLAFVISEFVGFIAIAAGPPIEALCLYYAGP